MIDSQSSKETLRALAFPVALCGLTAAVFFAVTQEGDAPSTAAETAGATGAVLPVENIEDVSFSAADPQNIAVPDVEATPLGAGPDSPASGITEAVSASLSWSTKSLPALPGAPSAATQVAAPSDLPAYGALTEGSKAQALTKATTETEPAGETGIAELAALQTDAPETGAQQSLNPSDNAGEEAAAAPHGAGNDPHHMMMDMPAADPNASACVAELQTIAGRTRIYFDSGATTVAPRDRASIYQMGALAQRCPEAQIIIDGFTDPKGDPNENLLLSWKRANNVLGVIREAGFDTMQFTTHSHMDNHPDYCIHYDVVDRRVEFVVQQNPKMAKSDTPLFNAPAATAASGPVAQALATSNVPSIRPAPRPSAVQ